MTPFKGKKATWGNAMNYAKHDLELGAKYPYDAPDNWKKNEKSEPPPAADWAHVAARGILANLNDRYGIQRELRHLDEDVRNELTQSIADIIREARKQFV